MVLFYFKSFSFVSSCFNEIHIFCFPSILSFCSPFQSIFHSVPFSVPRFSNTPLPVGLRVKIMYNFNEVSIYSTWIAKILRDNNADVLDHCLFLCDS